MQELKFQRTSPIYRRRYLFSVGAKEKIGGKVGQTGIRRISDDLCDSLIDFHIVNSFIRDKFKNYFQNIPIYSKCKKRLNKNTPFGLDSSLTMVGFFEFGQIYVI